MEASPDLIVPKLLQSRKYGSPTSELPADVPREIRWGAVGDPLPANMMARMHPGTLPAPAYPPDDYKCGCIVNVPCCLLHTLPFVTPNGPSRPTTRKTPDGPEEEAKVPSPSPSPSVSTKAQLIPGPANNGHDDPWEAIKAKLSSHPKTDSCPDPECILCSMRDCPKGCNMHYDKNGCPACDLENNNME